MDALAQLLDGPRGRDAYLLRASLEPPWSIELADDAPLGLIAVVAGSAWFEPTSGAVVELREGDILVAQGAEPATIAHAPGASPQMRILPGQRCVGIDGGDLAEQMSLGVRSWGNSPDGSTVLLIGCYRVKGEVSRRLLGGLPQVIRLSAAEIASPLLPMLADEVTRDDPGQSAILDRLFDVLLVDVLRAWHAREQSLGPGWYSAQSDRVVRRALELIHEDPARSWTIPQLADAVNVSRAALARRFTDLVGEPPMAYLTSWRLALAADRMLDPQLTLDTIAREVGYGSAFALSAAFKRERGMSPREYRALLRAQDAVTA